MWAYIKVELLLGDQATSILTCSSLQVVVTSPGYAKDVCSFLVSQIYNVSYFALLSTVRPQVCATHVPGTSSASI